VDTPSHPGGVNRDTIERIHSREKEKRLKSAMSTTDGRQPGRDDWNAAYKSNGSISAANRGFSEWNESPASDRTEESDSASSSRRSGSEWESPSPLRHEVKAPIAIRGIPPIYRYNSWAKSTTTNTLPVVVRSERITGRRSSIANSRMTRKAEWHVIPLETTYCRRRRPMRRRKRRNCDDSRRRLGDGRSLQHSVHKTTRTTIIRNGIDW